MNKNPFIWDDKSDQPFILKDKEYKKAMRKKHMWDYVPMLLSNLFIYPLGLMTSSLFKGKQNKAQNFFGMSVYLEKGEEQVNFVKELGVKKLLIRMPLSDIEKIDEYVAFASKFEDCEILINILQSREFIDDKELLKTSFEKIFKRFKNITKEFQIGNAINRTKWGFFSVKEYLEFYKVAFDLRNEKFSEVKLLGPSVIDFEYHFTIRALFSKYNIFFDKVSSLLYVDRRGAPENKQMLSFDIVKKIDFLYALASLSKRSTNKLVITETNWPISNTKPYAPTSEFECVDEDDYARFMLRYYLLALGSKKVETVYWHQLIAAGYGLIDHRKGLRKRTAFDVYKTMLKFLDDAEVIKYSNAEDLYVLTCQKDGKKFDVVWLNSKEEMPISDFSKVFDMFGNELKEDIKISENPIYAYHK